MLLLNTQYLRLFMLLLLLLVIFLFITHLHLIFIHRIRPVPGGANIAHSTSEFHWLNKLFHPPAEVQQNNKFIQVKVWVIQHTKSFRIAGLDIHSYNFPKQKALWWWKKPLEQLYLTLSPFSWLLQTDTINAAEQLQKCAIQRSESFSYKEYKNTIFIHIYCDMYSI